MSVLNDVKQKIYEKLSALVNTSQPNPSQPLGTVVLSDFKKDPLDMTQYQYFPVACITPPAITQSIFLDNTSVQRELTFNVMVMQKADNIHDTEQIENLMETLCDAIDTSITFDNVAVAGVMPTTSVPEPFIHNGHSFVLFDIIIRARVVKTFNYN